jgi:uncharacterized protein YkvS
MKYILIEFTSGLKGQGYQVIENGMVTKIVDLDGKDMELPESLEYKVVNKKELDSI